MRSVKPLHFPLSTSRRRLLAAGSLAAVAGILPAGQALASNPWPTRAVRLVVPFSAGGAADTSARAFGKTLGDVLGQTVIIENRTGGNAVVAASAVLQSPKDGYTFIWDAANQLTNPLLIQGLQFDYEKSFVPVSMGVRVPQVLAVRADFPAKTFAEFLEYVKAHPGEVSVGTPPAGAMGHLALAMLQDRAGVSLLHTPYRGGADAARDLMGGQIDAGIITLATAAGAMETGRIRVLALTSQERSPMFPNIPTIAEQGYPDYDMDDWFGVFAPAGTPVAVVDRMAEAIGEAARTQTLMDLIAPSGSVIVANSPQEFSQWLVQQRAALRKLIQDANISLN